MDEWFGWVGIAIGAVGVAVAVVAWCRPRSPRPEPVPPPDLRLAQVGGLGSSKGAPTETVKAKLELINDGPGGARNWQVSITNSAGPGVTLSIIDRHSKNAGSTINWHQDAQVGEVPPDQSRELPGWMYVEAPPTALEVTLPLVLQAEGMANKTGAVVVTFPSAGGPAVRIEF